MRQLRDILYRLRLIVMGHVTIVDTLKRIEAKMAKNQELIDRIMRGVEEQKTVNTSLITLLTNLAQQIRDAQDDPQELARIADAIETNNAEAAAAAVAANTVAEDEDEDEDTGEDDTGEGDDTSEDVQSR